MEPIQVIAITFDFVVFVVLTAVVHARLTPTPVPVPVGMEPTVEDVRNRLYV